MDVEPHGRDFFSSREFLAKKHQAESATAVPLKLPYDLVEMPC